jgi:GT2 family glycosyltransferase
VSAISPHVVVCIVSYRTPRDVAACLQALAASTHRSFEVVVCENGGPDAFAALQGAVGPSLPGGQPVTLICAPGNLGYAGGVNVCLAARPEADAWWVLNPDTQPDPGAMAALLERLAVGDCEAAGGPIRLPDGRIQSFGGHWRSWFARAVSIGYGAPAGETPDRKALERRLNYLSGASMMVSRKFLQAVGPMREDYFLYCEEVEWCLRARDKGMRLGYAPGGGVRHESGASTGHVLSLKARSRLSVRLNERNRLLLTRDLFPARLLVAAPAALAILVIRYAKAGAWRQMLYALGGWWAGLLNRRGPELPGRVEG